MTREGATLGDLARELSGRDPALGPVLEGAEDARIVGVRHDSRHVEPGDLFVVRRGQSFDGARFVTQAIERGAAALLAAHDDAPASLFGDGPRLPVLHVADVRVGMAYAAAAVYGDPSSELEIIGITGTNGKTTTTHLVRAAIDGALGRPSTGIIGTIGHSYRGEAIATAHTTPESDELTRVFALMKSRSATHVAMEVSSIAIDLERVRGVRFRVAAFTNLTQDHLEFHGSMDAYGASKRKLFTTLAPEIAVINVGDAFGERLAKEATCPVLRVAPDPQSSVAKSAEIAANDVHFSAQGTEVSLSVRGRTHFLCTRLLGMHNVENVLVTIGIVEALGLDVDRAIEALGAESGPPGRLERCDQAGDDIVVLVDYAHTPDALSNVLRGLPHEPGKRLLCVFGCGGDRDPSKRVPMGQAAGEHADIVIVTSDNPRTEEPAVIARAAAEGVVAAGCPLTTASSLTEISRGHLVELDRRHAIDLAIEAAHPGEIVLIAGKGHEDYQIIGHDKRPFDDRVEARRALVARRERLTRRPTPS